MSKNIEILNYLNLISPKLGKAYKLKGTNPLPDNFEFTEEKINDRLLLNQMQEFVSLPDFVHDDKKIIKKKIKNSIKNIKKILKNEFFVDFSEILKEKIVFYLEVRKEMSKIILKEFRRFDFNEMDAIAEIYEVDPLMSELLTPLFEEVVDFESLFSDLEEKYTISYSEKLKILEKRRKKGRSKTTSTAEIVKVVEKSAKTKSASKTITKSEKVEKSTEKEPKNAKKSEKVAKTEPKVVKKASRSSASLKEKE